MNPMKKTIKLSSKCAIRSSIIRQNFINLLYFLFDLLMVFSFQNNIINASNTCLNKLFNFIFLLIRAVKFKHFLHFY